MQVAAWQGEDGNHARQMSLGDKGLSTHDGLRGSRTAIHDVRAANELAELRLSSRPARWSLL
jgi:hypothetical protein